MARRSEDSLSEQSVCLRFCGLHILAGQGGFIQQSGVYGFVGYTFWLGGQRIALLSILFIYGFVGHSFGSAARGQLSSAVCLSTDLWVTHSGWAGSLIEQS